MSIYHCICPVCGKHHIFNTPTAIHTSLVDNRYVYKCTECPIELVRESWDARQNGTFDQFRVKNWKHNLTSDIVQRTIPFTEHTVITEKHDA